MKVKELVKLLEKQDQEKDVVIRFALSPEDEIGYVLEVVDVGSYVGTPAIYGEYTATKEDCDFMGQVDLKTVWEKEYGSEE